MKRVAFIFLGSLAVSAGTLAQSNPEAEKALLAAPRSAREGAMVIKWKADYTYDTLKPGTNRIVGYDQSALPTQQPVLGAVHRDVRMFRRHC